MKKYLVFLPILLLVFIISPSISHAASTTGYAWSENTGWIDFASTTVDDSRLSGYAYGENIGWINLTDSIVTNTNGVLSGYGWSENTGWINFSSTTINTSIGAFTGYAYGENIGWINFTDGSVNTAWRPQVVTPPTTPVYSGGSSGSSGSSIYIPRIIATTTATSTLTYLNSFKTLTFTTALTPNTTSPSVSTLQTLLTKLGYYTGPVTGFYGPLTEKAVKKYQIAKNIEPLGFVGPATRNALNSEIISNISTSTYTFIKDLEFGMEGLDITKLQTILNTLNFLKVSPTGYFGKLTESAVKEYQKLKGISPTGYVGPITRKELNK